MRTADQQGWTRMPLTPSLSPSDGERVAKPGEGFALRNIRVCPRSSAARKRNAH
jgi:hypothetical protein